MEMNSSISIRNLSKAFEQFGVIDDLSLDIEEGSITSVLAPSGAGKTTLLRIIAGLEKPSAGRVIVNIEALEGPSPEIGFMFQESSAFPWLTVCQNIKFGLSLEHNHRKIANGTAEQEILRTCQELNINRFLDYYPSQLSGGQKQRVVIARSLILRPRILLCDEPFSALDEVTRNDLRELLLEIHSHYFPTVLFITHSIEEAIFLGSRLIICSGPPLRCMEEMQLDFPGPRDGSLLGSEPFLKARKRVKELISSANRNPKV